VDFSNPDAAWRSQLNPDSGAVWDYLEGAGVKPGMGLPEVYSAINAGSVGRMGASDANNGGAPGTVADKVASMGPHREKAAQFLGGTWTPAEGGGVTMSTSGPAQFASNGGFDIGSLVALASDPMASPAQRGIVEALITQQMSMMDPMRQIEMQKAQLELAQMQGGGQNETLMERTALADAAGLTGEARNYYLATGEMPEAPKEGARPLTDPAERAQWGIPPEDTRPYAIEPGKRPELVGDSKGTTINNNMGGGPELGKLSTDYGYVLDESGKPKIDPNTGLPMAAPVPGSPAAIEAEKTKTKTDRTKTQGQMKLGTTLESINLNLAELENGGLPVAGVMGDARRTWIGRALTGDSAMDFANRTNQITDSAAFAEIQNMRDNSPTGGAVGQLTDAERTAIGNAVTALNSSTSPEEYARAAKAYRQLALDMSYGEGRWRLNEDGTVEPVAPESDAASAAAPIVITSDAEYDALPSGSVFVDPEGKTRRKP
jgi:hypothetical protein